MWTSGETVSPPNPHVFNPSSPHYAPRVARRSALLKGAGGLAAGLGAGYLAIKALNHSSDQNNQYQDYSQYGQ